MLHDYFETSSAAGLLIYRSTDFSDSFYERALVIELADRKHEISSQQEFDVEYKGQPIGTLIPDLIVDGRVIVDTKVVKTFNDAHIAQMIGYLTITGLRVGLLVNFKHAKLEWRRIVR